MRQAFETVRLHVNPHRGFRHEIGEAPEFILKEDKARIDRAKETSTKSGGKMSATTYKEFFAATPQALRPIVTALRIMVRRTAPGLTEVMRYKVPNYADISARYKLTLVYLMPANDHVNLGFYDGVSLKDPKRMLEGTGKQLRHVKVYTAKQAKNPALAALVKNALRVHAARAAPPKRPS